MNAKDLLNTKVFVSWVCWFIKIGCVFVIIPSVRARYPTGVPSDVERAIWAFLVCWFIDSLIRVSIDREGREVRQKQADLKAMISS